MSDPDELGRRILAGETLAVARAISMAEDGHPSVERVLAVIFPRAGNAYRLGITGPPGAGKSTLVNELVRRYRHGVSKVGVVAVDPTSPFSGGALLGDRVRMRDIGADPGVFIRSMASRGAFGGLAEATADAVDILDAFGCDPVLIETVGVGQSEVEIAGLADTTIVVLSPESGDGIQTMKAGLMEIADVFVVNKADRQGAERLAREIQAMLDLHHGESRWTPPVLQTIATAPGQGLDELARAIARHRREIEDSGEMERRRLAAIRHRMLEALRERFRRRLWAEDDFEKRLGELTRDVHARRTTPVEAVRILYEQFVDGERERRLGR